MTKNEIDQFPELEDEELIPEVLFSRKPDKIMFALFDKEPSLKLFCEKSQFNPEGKIYLLAHLRVMQDNLTLINVRIYSENSDYEHLSDQDPLDWLDEKVELMIDKIDNVRFVALERV